MMTEAQGAGDVPRVWWLEKTRSGIHWFAVDESDSYTVIGTNGDHSWSSDPPDEVADAVELRPVPATGQADVPGLLRLAADGREEYARNAPEHQADVLNTQAAVLRCAAEIAEGNYRALYGYLPSWRWHSIPVEPPAPPASSEPTPGGGDVELCEARLFTDAGEFRCSRPPHVSALHRFAAVADQPTPGDWQVRHVGAYTPLLVHESKSLCEEDAARFRAKGHDVEVVPWYPPQPRPDVLADMKTARDLILTNPVLRRDAAGREWYGPEDTRGDERYLREQARSDYEAIQKAKQSVSAEPDRGRGAIPATYCRECGVAMAPDEVGRAWDHDDGAFICDGSGMYVVFEPPGDVSSPSGEPGRGRGAEATSLSYQCPNCARTTEWWSDRDDPINCPWCEIDWELIPSPPAAPEPAERMLRDLPPGEVIGTDQIRPLLAQLFAEYDRRGARIAELTKPVADCGICKLGGRWLHIDDKCKEHGDHDHTADW